MGKIILLKRIFGKFRAEQGENWKGRGEEPGSEGERDPKEMGQKSG